MGYYGMPAAKLPPGPRSTLDDILLKIKVFKTETS
jgi:hypothetical protein